MSALPPKADIRRYATGLGACAIIIQVGTRRRSRWRHNRANKDLTPPFASRFAPRFFRRSFFRKGVLKGHSRSSQGFKSPGLFHPTPVDLIAVLAQSPPSRAPDSKIPARLSRLIGVRRSRGILGDIARPALCGIEGDHPKGMRILPVEDVFDDGLFGVDFGGFDVGSAQRTEVVEDDMNGDVGDWLARSQRGRITRDATTPQRQVNALNVLFRSERPVARCFHATEFLHPPQWRQFLGRRRIPFDGSVFSTIALFNHICGQAILVGPISLVGIAYLQDQLVLA